MRQLVPGLRKGFRELLRIFMEPLRDRPVDRIHPQRQIGREHHRRVLDLRIMRIRHRIFACPIFRRPLPRTCGALGEFPLIVEQIVEVVIVPFCRIGRPRAFQPAGDRVDALARAIAVLPAEALLLDARAFRLRTDIFRRVSRTMRLAERMTAGNQRNRLFVIHRHARKCLTDIFCSRKRIRLAVRPFRIDVDQAHLHGSERVFEVSITAIALVLEPFALGAPVNIFLGLPHIGTTTGKAERLETHRLKRAIADKNHQIGP